MKLKCQLLGKKRKPGVKLITKKEEKANTQNKTRQGWNNHGNTRIFKNHETAAGLCADTFEKFKVVATS